MEHDIMNKLMVAFESAGIHIYGKDFLCRALAVCYCYGGGPGGEYMRAPCARKILMKGWEILELAVLEKDWDVLRLVGRYVKELQEDRATWLLRTLDKLNVPHGAIKYSECILP